MTATHTAEVPSRAPAKTSLNVLRGPAYTIAGLRGDLDIDIAPALRERLLGLLGPGTRLLIIDLSEVPSCDVAGLAVLIGTQRRARAHGITVRLVALRPRVAELLRITGLDRSLTIRATLADALPQQRQALRVAASPQRAEAA
jgi:anti-anti-sigma factor